MRAWYLSDPEQECSAAILEGELGCRLLLSGGDAGVVEGLEPVDELELSEEHMGAAFGDTIKVSKWMAMAYTAWDFLDQSTDATTNHQTHP